MKTKRRAVVVRMYVVNVSGLDIISGPWDTKREAQWSLNADRRHGFPVGPLTRIVLPAPVGKGKK